MQEPRRASRLRRQWNTKTLSCDRFTLTRTRRRDSTAQEDFADPEAQPGGPPDGLFGRSRAT